MQGEKFYLEIPLQKSEPIQVEQTLVNDKTFFLTTKDAYSEISEAIDTWLEENKKLSEKSYKKLLDIKINGKDNLSEFLNDVSSISTINQIESLNFENKTLTTFDVKKDAIDLSTLKNQNFALEKLLETEDQSPTKPVNNSKLATTNDSIPLENFLQKEKEIFMKKKANQSELNDTKTFVPSITKTPVCKWHQSKSTVIVNVEIPAAQNIKVEFVAPNLLLFSCTANGNSYTLNLGLFDEFDSKNCKWKQSGRNVEINIPKIHKKVWKRLLTSKDKLPYIKVDHDRLDPDLSEDDDYEPSISSSNTDILNQSKQQDISKTDFGNSSTLAMKDAVLDESTIAPLSEIAEKKFVMTASADGKVKEWYFDKSDCLKFKKDWNTGISNRISGFEISRNAEDLFIGTINGNWQHYKYPSEKKIKAKDFKKGQYIADFHITKDNKFVYILDDTFVVKFDLTTNRSVSRISISEVDFNLVHGTRDDKFLLILQDQGGNCTYAFKGQNPSKPNSGCVLKYCTETNQVVFTFKPVSSTIKYMTVTSDDKCLLTYDRSDFMQIFSQENNKLLRKVANFNGIGEYGGGGFVQGCWVTVMVVTRGGQYLFTADEGGNLKQFSLNDLKLVKDYGKVSKGHIWRMGVTADDQYLLVSDWNGFLKQFCVKERSLFKDYGKIHDSEVTGMIVYP